MALERDFIPFLGEGAVPQTPPLPLLGGLMEGHVMYWGGVMVPYVRTTQKQKFVDPRYQKYHRWKQEFRLWANTQGFPDELSLEKSYHLDITIWMKGRTRSDLDNNCKAAIDACFKQDRRIIQIEARIVEKSGKDAVQLILKEIP